MVYYIPSSWYADVGIYLTDQTTVLDLFLINLVLSSLFTILLLSAHLFLTSEYLDKLESIQKSNPEELIKYDNKDLIISSVFIFIKTGLLYIVFLLLCIRGVMFLDMSDFIKRNVDDNVGGTILWLLFLLIVAYRIRFLLKQILKNIKKN